MAVVASDAEQGKAGRYPALVLVYVVAFVCGARGWWLTCNCTGSGDGIRSGVEAV